MLIREYCRKSGNENTYLCASEAHDNELNSVAARPKNGCHSRILIMLISWSFLAITAGIPMHAQNGSNTAESSEAAYAPKVYDPENLNLVGADVKMPSFADSFVPINSPLRQDLFRHGVALRLMSPNSLNANALDSPIDWQQQAYVGQRPTYRVTLNPILTFDLRQLGLQNAQLNIGGAFLRSNWYPAGPPSLAMSSFYFFKAFANHRLEVKTGYIPNDFEYVGLQVGGSVAQGAQGVYSVIPFEVGLSHFPLTAPAVNVRVQLPLHIYVKGGLQRSLDARGGSATIARNLTGFRFVPHGDGLVSIVETGYRTPPRKDSYGTWFRAGAIHNTTQYASLTGGASTGNYCAFLLVDRQIAKTDSAHPERGLFAGVSGIFAPAQVNAYAKYFEMRVYDEAPLARRPRDMASIVASRNNYSGAMVQKVMAQGGTVWHNSTSLTGSYNAHLHSGLFAGFGLSYVTGPAITPHVPNALTTSLQLNLFW